MKCFTPRAPALAAAAALVLAGCQADVVAPASATSERLAVPADPSLATAPLATALVRAQQLPGEFIVLFKAGAPVGNAAPGLMVAAERGRLRHVYSAAVSGFAASLTDSSARRIARHPHVLAVVPDERVTVAGAGVQTSAPWGLDRIDQKALPLGSTFVYAADGAGVTVYVLDTGINAGHVEFTGRVGRGYDAVTVGGTANDCHGHGTHVAGTVGGTRFGVAKAATLVGVRVLDCTGNGSTSTVIAGLDWVLNQKLANPALRAVVNMSLGGGVATVLDSAVARLVAAGVTTVVAAGNSAVDACTSSPARAPAAITVGATDASDRFATFSNHGSCVDVQAPGVGISSAYIGSTTAAASMSGTSMAAPHVAGAAALYVSANGAASPAQVAAALTTNATANVVIGTPTNTVNRLLYVGFLGAAPANQAPTAAITAPAAGASVVQGTSVTFAGGASDPESGTLTGAALVWTSNLAGQIGTGASFATSALAVGTHTITLTARDPQGAIGTATRSLTVTAAPPPPPAGLTGLLSSNTGQGCLATTATASSATGSVSLTACSSGAASQTWTVPAVGATGTARANGACLVAKGTVAESTVGTAACVTGAAAQQWTYTAIGELRSAANLCLSKGSAGPVLRACNGIYDAQRWTVR